MTAESNPVPSENSVGELSDGARSVRVIVAGILALALLLGGGLRFYRLGAEEMGRAEAAAWTAASAPTIASVVAAGRRIDPGKFGLYDVIFHYWIAAFGNTLGALRALCAILGTLAIVLVFASVREIMLGLDTGANQATAEFAGAFAALLYACNFQMITIDRTARMYSLVLVAVLAQLFFFVRTHRRVGVLNCAAAAILTVVAVATNYTALSFFAAEGLWLAYIFVVERRNQGATLSIVRPAIALIAAAAFFAPFALLSGNVELTALHSGILKWIRLRSLWWPLRALQVMTGNAALWPLLGLSIFGVWRQRKHAVLGSRLILFWLVVPFVIVMIASYTITPLMVERYVLASLVAFLALAGVGLTSLPSEPARYAFATLVLVQSLAHVHHHWRAPEDIQWREAAGFVASAALSGERVAVFPPGEPLFPLRYYLPPSQRDLVVSGDATFEGLSDGDQSVLWTFHCGREPMAIVQTALPGQFLKEIRSCYPATVRRIRGVEILAR